MASPELIDKAKQVLSDTFVMYMKAHGYHWNVIGPNFVQFHEFFGELYEELHDSIDVLAEHIRAMESFAPGTLKRITELSKVVEDDKIPTPEKMINNLIDTNNKVYDIIVETYELAESEKECGYSNYLQDRLTAHKKHGWMLRSIAGKKP